MTLKRRLGNWIVRTPWAWTAADRTVVHAFSLLEGRRSALEEAEAHEAIGDVMAARTVLRGPFAGLRYADLRTVASALSPKLLGTYEREIGAIVEACCTAGYEEILDIGCAEGYYAVGFARRCRQARVIACDASAEALALCAANARANGVADRIELRGPIDAATLAALRPGTVRLVFCDVDGFEAKLFVPEAVPGLAASDLLIETHDYLDPDITPDIVDTLDATHDVEILHSLDDVEKVYRYALPELDGLSRRTRLRLLAEGRPAVQRWLWCRARDRAGAVAGTASIA